MAKRTAIIDLESNSVRMVVFEKTSRFGFYLLKETKSRVRIGEGAYEKDGYLQEVPMRRTLDALQSFKNIIKNFKCTKTLCVATSALRDAPNGREFASRVQKELNINIKIIDGQTEAFFGGVAATNLLKFLDDAVTIDIGGGSTEMAKILDGEIVDTISLNIGTVRLKELFFDNRKTQDEIHTFINGVLEQIPSSFCSPVAIGIGGTIRSIADSIMEKEGYPLETVHGFEFSYTKYSNLIESIYKSSVLDLKPFGFKKDRIDTIREGSVIFDAVSKKLGIERVITSGVGVREGVYLKDILRNQNYKFPHNFNISVKSLTDRFSITPKDDEYIAKTSIKLFDALSYLHKVDDMFKYELSISAKLHSIGKSLSFYQEHLHSFYFILNNLNFGFSHEQKMLIALLTKYHSKKLPDFDDLKMYEKLLPDANVVNWLSFIITFSKFINTDHSRPNVEFEYKNHTLHVKSNSSLGLAKESIRKLVKPASFAISFS